MATQSLTLPITPQKGRENYGTEKKVWVEGDDESEKQKEMRQSNSEKKKSRQG